MTDVEDDRLGWASRLLQAEAVHNSVVHPVELGDCLLLLSANRRFTKLEMVSDKSCFVSRMVLRTTMTPVGFHLIAWDVERPKVGNKCII